MEIKLYKTRDQINLLNKVLTDEQVFNCTAREEITIMDPVVRIQGDFQLNFNYAYITEFNRYYFVKNYTMIRQGLYEVELSIDVLMSHRNAIMEQEALIDRQEFINNHYLDDELCEFYSQKIITTQKIPAVKGFIDGVIPNIILTTLG